MAVNWDRHEAIGSGSHTRSSGQLTNFRKCSINIYCSFLIRNLDPHPVLDFNAPNACFFTRTCTSPSGSGPLIREYYQPIALVKQLLGGFYGRFVEWYSGIFNLRRSPIPHPRTKSSLIRCVGENSLKNPRIYLILTPPSI